MQGLRKLATATLLAVTVAGGAAAQEEAPGRGEPLLFKLRAPTNAIVGGGFFEHYTTLPFSLAWRAFGPKNGLATQQSFWDRIARLRREEMAPWEDPTSAASSWWSPSSGPRRCGRAGCLGASRRAGGSRALPIAGEQPTFGGGFTEPVPTRRRMGQGTFQAVVLDAYGRQCAITAERAVPALDDAHIRPFAQNRQAAGGPGW